MIEGKGQEYCSLLQVRRQKRCGAAARLVNDQIIKAATRQRPGQCCGALAIPTSESITISYVPDIASYIYEQLCTGDIGYKVISASDQEVGMAIFLATSTIAICTSSLDRIETRQCRDQRYRYHIDAWTTTFINSKLQLIVGFWKVLFILSLSVLNSAF